LGDCEKALQQANDIIGALQKSEEKFRRILASLAEVAWTSDRQGRTTYVSPKVINVLGYTKPEMCAAGNALRMGLIHPGDFGRVKQSYRDLFDKQLAFDEEYRVRRKDGEWIWVHDRATGTYLEDGAWYADGVFRDVTRRKQREAELQWKTAFLEAQANSTIDGILVVDAHGRRLLRNRRFVELFGIPREIAEAKTDRPTLEYVASLMADPHSFRSKVQWLYKHRTETSRDELQLSNGMVVDRYSAPVVSTDSDGEYFGRVWIFRDITERKRSEEKLRHLSMAIEQSPVSVMITDAESNITYVNEQFTKVTGYTAGEVIGKNPRFLNARFFSPEYYQNLWATITRGEQWRGELCNKRQNGEIYWEAANITAITGDKGTITHYLAIKEDITERKKAERELLTSRQMLKSVLDAIPQRVFWKDQSSIYLGCNRPFATDAGLTGPAEIVGKSDLDLNWSGMAEAYRADDKLVMEQRVPKLSFQEPQTRPDGSLLWLQTNKLPLLDADGHVTGVLGTYEDISERKRAERELELTKFCLENASDTIEWLDADSRFIYVNDAGCRALGYTREEMLGLTTPVINPFFTAESWQNFWNDLKIERSRTFESQHRCKDGRLFPVEVTANYLEFDGQELCLAFVRDISERRKMESELRQAHKLEGIGQLAAGIAHEINTPIQFITDNLTFLRDSCCSAQALTEKYRSAVLDAASLIAPRVIADLQEAEKKCDLSFIFGEVPHAIEQSLDGTARVTKIVRAMKEFSHPDAADKTMTDLNKAIESTVTVARHEWKYVSDVVMDLDPALPAVMCYPGDINQVILNLVVNAAHSIGEKIKQGEKGRICIRTRVQGDSAEVSIADTGTGIPEAIRNRIFDPFFTTKEVGMGTGQGLSLAHTVVVKKHSGKIWFETELGLGSTFFITLPFLAGDRKEKADGQALTLR